VRNKASAPDTPRARLIAPQIRACSSHPRGKNCFNTAQLFISFTSSAEDILMDLKHILFLNICNPYVNAYGAKPQADIGRASGAYIAVKNGLKSAKGAIHISLGRIPR
jgi:hypothetical protein